jgi:hypothetical protein
MLPISLVSILDKNLFKIIKTYNSTLKMDAMDLGGLEGIVSIWSKLAC